MLAPGEKLLQFEVLGGRVVFREATWYALETLTTYCTETTIEHRTFDDRAQSFMVHGDVLSEMVELPRFRSIDTASYEDFVRGHMKIEACSSVFGQRSMWKHSRNVCLERRLVR